MASSSKSPQERSIASPKLYDAFISHRGPDVKDTLAKQLYDLLQARQCRAFLDREEIQGGDHIPSAICNGISSSAVQIAIFSKGYAESSWCLNELVLMLEQTDALFIPVFYYVEPWELRHIQNKKSRYAAAFSHYHSERRNLDKLEEWKEALASAANISGYELSQHQDNLCEKIVSRVLQETDKRRPLHVADHPVGLAELVQDFERSCSETVKDKAKIVGIYGLGGSGKTTLTKELINRKRSGYHASCFLSDVRESDTKGELHCLQSQLLKDLFGEERKFGSIAEGIGQLKNRLGSARDFHFLIVLDDVDSLQQLRPLLFEDMLSPGSLVIVSTRNQRVLMGADITIRYKMKEMDRDHAKELFCSHAFQERDPPFEYENLVESFVEFCGGLPLSLAVLGAHVYRRDKHYWELQLEKVKKIQPEDIMKRLKISFDGLNREEKQIFIDIACFFNKMYEPDMRSIAISIWKASGWSAEHALQTLQDKSLVEVEKDRYVECFKMHDHLRDLGRQMADELGPPRLWRPDVLRSMEAKGFEKILAETKGRCFHSFWDLSLATEITYFISNLNDSSETEVLWLDINNGGGNLKNIPSWIPLLKLHCLTVREMEELWTTFQQQLQTNTQPPLQLRDLRITQCFRGSSLPEEFCDLQLLEHLELSQCPMLSSLPHRFGDLKNLRYMELSNCRQLKELPHSFEQLIRLKCLILSCCWKLKLRLDMLKNITTLEYLNLTRCHELEELPRQITNQASLTRLFVEGTGMRDVPTNIGELGNLEELRIGSPMLTSLPSSLGNLSYLNSLLIDGCPQLEYLPQSLCLLDLLKQVRIRASGLRELPFGSAGSSNFEVTSRQASNSACNLRPSITENCLQTLWNALQSLWIERRITEHESLQTYFPNKLPASLETLSLVANPQLMEIPILPQSLNILEICVCKMLKNMRGIAGLVKLRRLVICSCPELDELPSFADLASLEEFKIQGCPKVKIIQGLENCKSLQVLTAEVPLILTCDTISAFKPCILSMKTYPWEMMIRGRVTHRVKPIVDSWSLPSLTVLQLEKDSDWDNITQDLFNTGFLWYEEEKESNNEESGSSGVKVVHIAVCSEGSAAFPEYCVGRRLGSNPNVKQRKAILATGEGEIVAVAFRKLIKLLK